MANLRQNQDIPFWKDSRVHPGKFEVFDGSGAVFATNEAFPDYPHAQGVILQHKRWQSCAPGSELPPHAGQNRR